MVEESIEENAFFHVRPNVDVSKFLLVCQGVIDALSEEAIGMGSIELLMLLEKEVINYHCE